MRVSDKGDKDKDGEYVMSVALACGTKEGEETDGAIFISSTAHNRSGISQ